MFPAQLRNMLDVGEIVFLNEYSAIFIILTELHKYSTQQNFTFGERDVMWPLLLTWFNFNPSMDK